MEIVVTGSVAFDYLMRFPGYFRDHILPDRLDSLSLSFLVESMSRQRGGTGPNIAYNLALFGSRPWLMATVGEDFDDYRTWLERHGVNTSLTRVIPGEFTASFFVNTDRSNAQIASFYPGAMAHAAELSLRGLERVQPDLVVISPNDPGAMDRFARECTDLELPFLYDPSQQIVRLEAEVLRRGLQGARAVFVNDYEFGMVQNKTGLSTEEILAEVDFMVVTYGEKGAIVYQQDWQASIPPVIPDRIADPTGVGDAFRGGFLSGYSRGWDLELCGQMGALAATYCLEKSGPQGHHYSLSEFVNRFRQHFDDSGRLDDLI